MYVISGNKTITRETYRFTAFFPCDQISHSSNNVDLVALEKLQSLLRVPKFERLFTRKETFSARFPEIDALTMQVLNSQQFLCMIYICIYVYITIKLCVFSPVFIH